MAASSPLPLLTGWTTGDCTIALPPAFDGDFDISLKQAQDMVDGAAADIPRLLALCTQDMEHHSTSAGVVISKHTEPESALHVVRGIVDDVPSDFDMVPNYFCLGGNYSFNQRMRTVDEMYTDGRAVKTLLGQAAELDQFGNVVAPAVLPWAGIRYTNHATGVPLIWDRDFVFLQHTSVVEVDGDQYFVSLAKSIKRPELVDTGHKFVRGTLFDSGYVVKLMPPKPGADPRAPATTRWHFVMRIETGGNIPVWLQNLLAPKQAMTIGRARDAELSRRAACGMLAGCGVEYSHKALAGAFFHARRVNRKNPFLLPFTQPTDAGTVTLRFMVGAMSGSLRVEATGSVSILWLSGDGDLDAGSAAQGTIVATPGTAYALRVVGDGTMALQVVATRADGSVWGAERGEDAVLGVVAP